MQSYVFGNSDTVDNESSYRSKSWDIGTQIKGLIYGLEVSKNADGQYFEKIGFVEI